MCIFMRIIYYNLPSFSAISDVLSAVYPETKSSSTDILHILRMWNVTEVGILYNVYISYILTYKSIIIIYTSSLLYTCYATIVIADMDYYIRMYRMFNEF